MTRTKVLIDSLLVALLYAVSARVGQMFAIEPGNVTPVWIPSGLMIALALHMGKHIWPGVFLGAFIGNIWVYFSSETIISALSAIAAATFNGLGDVLCCVVMAQIVANKTQTRYPLTNVTHLFTYFKYAVVAGPLISAIFGVGGLFLFDHIASSQLLEVLTTWFVGDASGAMIFGPLLLSWLKVEPVESKDSVFILLALSVYAVFITAGLLDILAMPWFIYIVAILLAPIALFAILHSGQRTVFTVQALLSATAVYATSNQYGIFLNTDGNHSLMGLQVFLVALALVMFTVAILVFQQQRSSQLLQTKKDALENLYRKDQLTNTWNRYRITEFIDIELSRMQRHQRPFGVIMLDIDNFKSINDYYGHRVGDKVLVSLCELIGLHIRDLDLFGRWGGEEFLVVATDTNENSLKQLAEKIRALVECHEFEDGQRISVSLGATMSEQGDSIMQLIDRADEALYRAKEAGKNQVSWAPQSGSE